MTRPRHYRGGSAQPRDRALVVPVSEDEQARIRWLAAHLRTDMAPLARKLLLDLQEQTLNELGIADNALKDAR